MDVGTGVELEYSYGAGDGRTRSGVASMPKERSGRPRLDRSCDWEKYGYDNSEGCLYPSSRDNLSTDLGCILCISSLANFLHVHSTKHVWCVTSPHWL